MPRSNEIGLLRRTAEALRRQGDVRAAEQIERTIRALAREDLPGQVKRLLESAQESSRRPAPAGPAPDTTLDDDPAPPGPEDVGDRTA